MNAIINRLEHLELGILNAATQGIKIPGFVGWKAARIVTYLMDRIPSKLDIKTVVAQDKDKLTTLVDLLLPIGMAPGIVFCNFRDSIEKVAPCVGKSAVNYCCLSEGMEQGTVNKSKSRLFPSRLCCCDYYNLRL